MSERHDESPRSMSPSEGGEDDRAATDVAGRFRLTGDALVGGRTDATDADARPDGGDTSAEAGTHLGDLHGLIFLQGDVH